MSLQLAAEVQQLRVALRDERRKNEKLQLTLEIEKEANAQAQRVIEGIRNLDTSDTSVRSCGSSLALL
jgi:hypothetical protein